MTGAASAVLQAALINQRKVIIHAAVTYVPQVNAAKNMARRFNTDMFPRVREVRMEGLPASGFGLLSLRVLDKAGPFSNSLRNPLKHFTIIYLRHLY
jgi:hypothetical protein